MRIGIGHGVACGLGGAVVLLFGLARQPEQEKPSWKNSPVVTPDSSRLGRFQIVASTIKAADTFLLDTATGDSWIIIHNTDPDTHIERMGWEPMAHFGPPTAP